MARHPNRSTCMAAIALTIACPIFDACGQSAGGTFRIDQVTISGGGTLEGGAFGLSGTVGQPTTAVSSGGTFTLHAGARISSDTIFHNGFEAN